MSRDVDVNGIFTVSGLEKIGTTINDKYSTEGIVIAPIVQTQEEYIQANYIPMLGEFVIILDLEVLVVGDGVNLPHNCKRVKLESSLNDFSTLEKSAQAWYDSVYETSPLHCLVHTFFDKQFFTLLKTLKPNWCSWLDSDDELLPNDSFLNHVSTKELDIEGNPIPLYYPNMDNMFMRVDNQGSRDIGELQEDTMQEFKGTYLKALDENDVRAGSSSSWYAKRNKWQTQNVTISSPDSSNPLRFSEETRPKNKVVRVLCVNKQIKNQVVLNIKQLKSKK